MGKYDKLWKWLKDNSAEKYAGGHDIHTPRELVGQIISSVDTESKDILVLFNVEFVVALIEKGTDPSKIAFLSDHAHKTMLMEKLGVKYIMSDMNTTKKFDVTISNVPYNTREETHTGAVNVSGGKMGTVGNKTLGRQLNRLQRKLTKEGGTIAQMGLKGNMLTDAIEDPNWNPELISLMVDKTWWRYNTFWAVGTKEDNQYSFKIYGNDIKSRICAKIFKKGDWTFKVQQDSFKQLKDKGFITDVDNGNPLCIVRNKKKNDMKIIRMYATDKGLNKIVYGPKFMHYMAESAITWLATDEPVLCDCSVVFSHKTLAEAEKQKLFTENNPLLRFTWKAMNLKGQDQFWQYCKVFDLNQITTGFEYPAEYNLTQEEQDFLDAEYSRN